MSMKTTTIMIKDSDTMEFRRRLDKVLSRYDEERIFNIDTGMVHDGYDSRGYPKMYYYAIIVVKGSDSTYGL